MEYISCVIEAINVVESSNASDSVVASVRSVQSGRVMAPGFPAGPPLRKVAPAAGPSLSQVAPATGSKLRQVAPTGPISSSTSGSGIGVKIIEQPAKKCPKFRYEVEGRFAGSIPGANSKKDLKTYPTIEITNYTGKAKIIVSCVTKNKPYRPHPHKLVGRDNCSDGLCVMMVDITPENREVIFSNIGIQCVKRNDIAASLALRKEQKIDPFRTGFDHGTSTRDMDLHAVRLCFQVFPGDGGKNRYYPIVSDVIYNGPKTPDLKILQSSHVSGSARGGTRVILLCEEMKHEDVIVTLHTEEGAGGAVTWRAPADCVSFHKNVAVVFDTPPYKDTATQSQITAYIQLQSKSTGERSNSIRFIYEPEPGPELKRRKPLPKHFLERLENISPPPVWCHDAVKTEPCGVPPPPVWYPDPVKMEPCEHVSPGRMDTSPVRQNSYEPVRHETSYHHQKWNQNTPSTSHTGYNEEFPWPAHVQNQSCTHDMHASPIVMPNMTVTSPNNPDMTFYPSDVSTQARGTAPPRQFLTMLQRQTTLPQNNVTSPQDQISLPERQVNLPRRQVTLPQDHLASLQGRLLPDQMKSQYLTSHHVPHESVNVGQQSVEQLIETNGESSILKLLTNGERTYNSGDIAAIAQDLVADDLSDSFSQLMTVSDNLKF